MWKSYLYFVLIRQLQEERVTYIRIREANNISIQCQSHLDDVTSFFFQVIRLVTTKLKHNPYTIGGDGEMTLGQKLAMKYQMPEKRVQQQQSQPVMHKKESSVASEDSEGSEWTWETCSESEDETESTTTTTGTATTTKDRVIPPTPTLPKTPAPTPVPPPATPTSNMPSRFNFKVDARTQKWLDYKVDKPKEEPPPKPEPKPEPTFRPPSEARRSSYYSNPYTESVKSSSSDSNSDPGTDASKYIRKYAGAGSKTLNFPRYVIYAKINM